MVLIVAKVLATWWRLRVSSVCLLVTTTVSIGVSVWQSLNNPGDLSQPLIVQTFPFIKDFDSFCQKIPYIFEVPFSFYVDELGMPASSSSSSSSTQEQQNVSYCGFSYIHSQYRLCIAVATIVCIVPLLLYRNCYSNFGTQVYFCSAILWYSAFVIDVEALVSGTASCRSNFEGTEFATFLDSGLISIDCTPIRVYTITPFIDFCIASAALLLSQAWFHCTDLYDSEGHTGFNIGPDFRPSETLSDIRASLAMPWWEEKHKVAAASTYTGSSNSSSNSNTKTSSNPMASTSMAKASSSAEMTHVGNQRAVPSAPPSSSSSNEPAWTKE